MKRPIAWIVPAYLLQGIPYALVSTLAAIFYKNIHIPNGHITFYVSILLLPWAIKPIWSPWLERLSNQLRAVWFCQLLIGLLLALLSLVIFTPFYHIGSLFIFLLLAILGATYDVLSDSVYLHYLHLQAQAQYIGIRTIAYQVGRIIVQGGLVVLVGCLMKSYGLISAWSCVFILLSLLVLLLNAYQRTGLGLVANHINNAPENFLNVFASFFKLPHILIFLLFAFFYNLPEAQLQRILPLFLLAKDGVHLSMNALGWCYGVCGTIAMLAGVVVSGILLAKYQKQQWLLKFSLLAALVNSGYVYLAYHPATHHLVVVLLIVAIAQFAFGLSNSAYMFCLLKKVSDSHFKMTYYAILTAVMALSFAVFGAASGMLQTYFGYPSFFLWVVLSGFVVAGLACFQDCYQ